MITTQLYDTGKEASKAVRQGNIGLLNHNISLTIGTHVVKDLFAGESGGPIGLFQFATMVKEIMEASKKDDPYADQMLIKLENAISRVRKYIKTALEQRLADEKSYPRGIAIELPGAKEMITTKLQFSTEYAYLAAFMLAECDELVNIVIRQAEMGVTPHRELGKQLYEIRRQVRKVLSMPVQWHETGVMRADIKDDSPKAKLAREFMGELDRDVLMKKVIPGY